MSSNTKPKPTTRSLFYQPELDEESETEFQSSHFDFPSTQADKNVMQDVLLFSELSSREQLAHIEMDPPAEIEDSSSFFHNGVQFSVSAQDFSPTQMDEVELPAASSSTSAASESTTMRPPNSFSEPLIDEWRFTIPLAPAVPPAPESASNAVPPRVVPVTRAPAVDSAPVAAPPLMLIPRLVPPGALLEPLFPLADPEPVFGAITLGTALVQEYLPLVLPSPVLAARFLSRVSIQDLSSYRPRSARPRFCCRDCFGGNASGAGSGVSRREQVA